MSIVTPSFNQQNYLEETIRSVLLQGYPELEYIVIDGASTDGSVDIIEKYQKWLAFSVSEPDHGQAEAINKGLRRSTGALFNWINSDDLLQPHTLQLLAGYHQRDQNAILAGDVIYRDDLSGQETTVDQHNVTLKAMVEFWSNAASFHQPGIFVPMHLIRKVGLLDERMHYAFDYEFFCRLLLVAGTTYVRHPVATYRIHDRAKSVSLSDRFLSEVHAASKRQWSTTPDIRFPSLDPKGAGLTLRVALWEILHGRIGGTRLLLEACRIDPLGAFLSTLLYFPGWVWRRWRRRGMVS